MATILIALSTCLCVSAGFDSCKPNTSFKASSLLIASRGSSPISSCLLLTLSPCTASKYLFKRPVSVFWSFSPLYNTASSSSKLLNNSLTGSSPNKELLPFSISADTAARASSTFLAFTKAGLFIILLYASNERCKFCFIFAASPLFASRRYVASTALRALSGNWLNAASVSLSPSNSPVFSNSPIHCLMAVLSLRNVCSSVADTTPSFTR